MEEYNYNEHVGEQEEGKTNSIVKVFGYMFAGLLVTAVVSYLTFLGLVHSAISEEAYVVLIIATSILSIIILFIDRLILSKGNVKAGFVGYFLFAISMGIMLSTIYLVYSAQTVALAIGVAASTFGVMSLYGLITKRNLTSLGMFGVGLLWGSILIAVINLIFQNDMVYWISEYLGLGAMLAITAYDVNKSKMFIEAGRMEKNIAILLAIDLYTDFIYILIKLLAIIGASRKN